MKKQQQTTASVVGERLSFLQGARVRVVVSPFGDDSREPFEGLYIDTVPAGKDYLTVFRVGDKRHLIKTSAIVEMVEM